MEKKGDLLTQLAIISDLIEKANIKAKENIITFNLNRDEFERVFKYVSEKYEMPMERPEYVFNLVIGDVTFIFNMSNA